VRIVVEKCARGGPRRSVRPRLSEPNPACPAVAARCPRCGASLVRAAMPPGTFGIEGEACFECDDVGPARPTAWRCPNCGGVFLLGPSAD
jgi:PHP family Zn ribbon phosphoesterase